VRRALILAALALGADAQDSGPSVYEIKYRYEKPLKRVRGVQDVSIAGSGGDLRLVIRVENDETREALRVLIGDQIGATRIHYSVSGGSTPSVPTSGATPASDCGNCPCPCHRGRTVAEPRRTETEKEKGPEEECDILRELRGLPRIKRDVHCKQMVGWTNDPAKYKWLVDNGLPHWRSAEMSGLKGSDKTGVPCPEHGAHNGEFLAYTYYKHRQFCPYGMKQLMDSFTRMTPK
jgi:hypothetical protein